MTGLLFECGRVRPKTSRWVLRFAGTALLTLVSGTGIACQDPAIGAAGALTDKERSCLDRWQERSLPPAIDVAVPPEIPRQPTLRGVRLWDREVVAFAGEEAFRVDLESNRLVRSSCLVAPWSWI